MEFILIPLRNVQIVFVSHWYVVQPITSISSVAQDWKYVNIIPVFKKGIKLKPATTDQSVSFHKLLKSWNLSCVITFIN